VTNISSGKSRMLTVMSLMCIEIHNGRESIVCIYMSELQLYCTIDEKKMKVSLERI
jgi:hypothetical protein